MKKNDIYVIFIKKKDQDMFQTVYSETTTLTEYTFCINNY